MGHRLCDKNSASLLWTLLECVFFSGVVLGWSWLALIFRADHYLLAGCNVTFHDVTPLPPTPAPTPAPFQKPVMVRRPCKRKPTFTLEDQPSESRLRYVRDAPTTGNETFAVSSPLPASLFSGPGTHPVLEPGGRGAGVTEAKGEGVEGVEEDGEGGGEEEEVCMEQRELLRLLFAVVVVLRDLFVLPLGAFFDKYGTTRTRLLTVLIFGVGTLMMTFTSAGVPWLIVPALTLTGVAGVAVLLTNIQIANLFGQRRHLVLALYCGASLSSGFITYMMQLSHDQGVYVQTSFMFLTSGLVPMLVSTVAFLPKTRVPWPLPANYGKRRNQSLDETLLQAGVAKLRRPSPQFWPKGGHQLFVVAMLWHGVHSLHTSTAETLVVDVGHLKDGLGSDLEHVFGWMQLLSIPLALLPGMLIDRRRARELGVAEATQQMQNIVSAILVTSVLAVGERGLIMAGERVVPCLVLAFLVHALHRVFLLTTSLAFLMHVHFAQEHMGKYVGLTLAASAFISGFQFILRFYLLRHPLLAHSLVMTLLVLSLGHAFNVWNCCRRRLIRDHPDHSHDYAHRPSGHALLEIHIQTDDSNLRPEAVEAGPGSGSGSGSGSGQGTGAQGTNGHGACPGTSGCCPGPSGQGSSHHHHHHHQAGHSKAEGGPCLDEKGEGEGRSRERPEERERGEDRASEGRTQTEKAEGRGQDDRLLLHGRDVETTTEEAREREAAEAGLGWGWGCEKEKKGRDREAASEGRGEESDGLRSQDPQEGRGQQDKHKNGGLHVVIKEPEYAFGIDT